MGPRVEAQKVQNETSNNIKEAKDLDSIIRNMKGQENEMHRKQRWRTVSTAE